MPYRVGIGYDIHRLGEGRKLFLGGVEIPFSRGLIGHSDADVVSHAICDALLGACGAGDIGVHFPDTAPELKDISGIELLRRTYEIVRKIAPANIINIDVVAVCDEPKLVKYSRQMKKAISGVLHISSELINIKAKTSEGTAPDAISSYAVALVEVG